MKNHLRFSLPLRRIVVSLVLLCLLAAAWAPAQAGRPTGQSTAHSPAYDSRAQGLVTPVKDQGRCGSGWAFASAAVMETALLKSGVIGDANDPQADLSEQYLIQCNLEGMGCRGGRAETAHDYHYTRPGRLQQDSGAVLEENRPYTSGSKGQRGACKPGLPHTYQLSAWQRIAGDQPEAINEAIYRYGAVAVSLWAGYRFRWYLDDFSWVSGDHPSNAGNTIFGDGDLWVPYPDGRGGYTFKLEPEDDCLDSASPDCALGATNHAVALVGYDESRRTWILKNSWGTEWGDGGYMEIAYWANNVGTDPSYVTVRPPVPVPNDSPTGALELNERGGKSNAYFHLEGVENASEESGDPHFIDPLSQQDLGPGLKTVWYTFTAYLDGRLTLDTFGSSYDTLLGVWLPAGSGGWNSVAWNDNAAPGITQSKLTVLLQAGATYVIEVAERPPAPAGGGQRLRLHVLFAPNRPPANDALGSPLRVALDSHGEYHYRQDIYGARTASGDPVFYETYEGRNWPYKKFYRTVWFVFTAPQSARYLLETSGSNFDTVLGVWVRNARNQLVLARSGEVYPWVGDVFAAASWNNDFGASDWGSLGGWRSFSRVGLDAVAGTEYWIEAAAYALRGYSLLELHITPEAASHAPEEAEP